jgi:hypothetical protein
MKVYRVFLKKRIVELKNNPQETKTLHKLNTKSVKEKLKMVVESDIWSEDFENKAKKMLKEPDEDLKEVDDETIDFVWKVCENKHKFGEDDRKKINKLLRDILGVVDKADKYMLSN